MTWRVEEREEEREREKEKERAEIERKIGIQLKVCELTICLLPELHNRKSGVQSGCHAEAQIWMVEVQA